MIETRCTERGLCCESCQEDVNCYRCAYCGKEFWDDDEIYCIHHSQSDSEHLHKKCKEHSEWVHQK